MSDMNEGRQREVKTSMSRCSRFALVFEIHSIGGFTLTPKLCFEEKYFNLAQALYQYLERFSRLIVLLLEMVVSENPSSPAICKKCVKYSNQPTGPTNCVTLQVTLNGSSSSLILTHPSCFWWTEIDNCIWVSACLWEQAVQETSQGIYLLQVCCSQKPDPFHRIEKFSHYCVILTD